MSVKRTTWLIGLPALLAAAGDHPSGRYPAGGFRSSAAPTASSSLLATETYDLALASNPTPAFPNTLRDAILAHPTMAEGLGDLFAKVPPRSGP